MTKVYPDMNKKLDNLQAGRVAEGLTQEGKGFLIHWALFFLLKIGYPFDHDGSFSGFI